MVKIGLKTLLIATILISTQLNAEVTNENQDRSLKSKLSSKMTNFISRTDHTIKNSKSSMNTHICISWNSSNKFNIILVNNAAQCRPPISPENSVTTTYEHFYKITQSGYPRALPGWVFVLTHGSYARLRACTNRAVHSTFVRELYGIESFLGKSHFISRLLVYFYSFVYSFV